MKIHSLQFKNINSLVGEWEIDFSDPAFMDSGFFAITGPTGAGKSTVLDAVCLALYGRTPRLGKISNTQNDMMSTNTGECMAEVVFGTEHGLFRSSWHQKRAHKKPGGALQQPERRLSDEATGAVIETKVRDLEALIEEYTGMDFDRFTRTMFLAQGGFAAFLDAPDTERSGILEEITGTQVYSDLSMMVYRRARDEESKLQDIRREYDGLRLLTPEEEAFVQERLDEALKRVGTLGEDLKALEDQVRWLDTLDRFMGEREVLQVELDEVEQAMNDFSGDSERLERAKRARGAEGAYLDVLRRREALRQIHGRLEQERKLLPDLEEMAVKARYAKEILEKAVLKAREDRDADAVRAAKARVFDSQIAEKQKNTAENDRTIEALESDIARVHQVIKDMEVKRSTVLERADGAERFLSENACDSSLSEDMSGIEHRCREYLDAAGRLARAVEDHRVAAERETSRKSAVDTLGQEVRSREQEREALASVLAEQVDALKALLGGREVRDVRETYRLLGAREQVLARLLKDARALGEKEEKCAKVSGAVVEKDAAARDAEKDLEAATGRESSLTGKQEGLLAAVSLAEAASSARDIRDTLEDGVPCPVCGSLEHPYASGNVPELAPVREEAERVAREVAAARKEVTRLTRLSAALRTKSGMLAKERDSLYEELERDTRVWEEVAAGQSVNPEGEGPAAAAVRALEACRDELTVAASLQNRMDTLEQEIATYRDQIGEHERDLQGMKDTLSDARSELARLEQDEEHSRGQVEDTRSAVADRLAGFLEAVAKYGCRDGSSPEGEVAGLNARKERYEKCRATLEEAVREAERLSLEMEKENTKKSEKESSCRDLREKAATAGKECADLRAERALLYGEKDPDEEQERLIKAVGELEEQYSASGEELKRQESACEGLLTRLSVQGQDEQELAAGLGVLELECAAMYGETGFSSEEEFAAALLPEEVFTDLEERRDRLSDLLAAAKTRTGEKEREIARHQETGAVSEPRVILVQRLEEVKGYLDQARKKFYYLESELSGNKQRRDQARDLGERLFVQDRVVQTWTKLDRLIGSANGKNFRTFAQGLTLGILLNSANVHLRHLSDRYRLTRTKDQPLGILVIDSYRAGEVRPTKNLSGGETFIVSLALALGLSDLAGKNVRVDSLFLDEGFGTLDEEALDTALSALGNLRQEGKLIGVISHVQAVKDRVPVQIQVDKLPGGRSRLSGPGCRSRG